MNLSKKFKIACSRIDEAFETKATALSLRGLKLHKIPESIGQLDGLQELYLHHNNLKELPDCIGNLSKLRCLHLDDNKFTNISECIGQLAYLEELYLEENQLEHLPSSLGQLTKLRLLRASHNQLKHFPLSLTKCTNLVMLDLAENQLEELPESLRDLENLKMIFLHGNNALGIPQEKLGPPRWCTISSKKTIPNLAPQLLKYYFSTYKLDKRPLNEAKLILVGRGGAGKTSLRKRLISDEFDENEDKTPGIEVVPWSLELNKEKVNLNVWDFGGQDIMYTTHQFFLTKRSLYVLVINAREGDQDANVEYWLNLIKAYGEDSPVLIVVNKCEQYPLDLDEYLLRKSFPCIREFVWTDCKTKKGLPKLRAVIERETSALPDLHTPFPEKWFAIKKRLEVMPEDYITYDAYKNLCSANQEEDITKQEVLADFLNDLGSILYFPDDLRLCFLGVLKPDWVTQGIYGLLNADKLKAAGGVLVVSEIGTLLDNTRYPKQHHSYLLALMERFELCFEMLNTHHEMFLIPELLPKKTPDLTEWNNHNMLGFEYHYNILPEGLLPRFIVRTHILSEGYSRWHKGVELMSGRATALVRADLQRKCVDITVRGPGRQPRELLAVIRQHFEDIHKGIKGLAIEEKVPVPGHPEVMLDYRELLIREAEGESKVDFVTNTQLIKQSLGRLLDNFEEPSSRQERVTILNNGKFIMKNEINDYSHSSFNQSVVGKHMQNIRNAIGQLPDDRAELREVLDELCRNVLEKIETTESAKAKEVAKRLEQLIAAAKEDEPNKSDFQYFADKLLDTMNTVTTITGPLITIVTKLTKILGF